jgi:hypothetical protein
MTPGLIAGAVGALLAVLLSLPLRSPDDVFFNALTVGIGASVLALVAGAAWATLGRGGRGVRAFQVSVGAGFLAAALAALGAETLLERTFAYAAPLAAVSFGSIAVLTPLLARRRLPTWSGAAALAVPLIAGFALGGIRDTTSEALRLPSMTSTASTSSTATSAAGSTTPTATAASSTGTPANKADLQGVNFVIGEGSQAQFTVNEKLAQLPLPNDAMMLNSALGGQIHLDGRPSAITLDLTKFTSDQSRRDAFIRQSFSRQPTATVTITDIGTLPDRYTPGTTIRQRVAGTISILGNEAPIAIDVQARMDEAGVLSLLGALTFTWSDLKMTAPSTPTVQVKDTVQAQILLVAKPSR